MPAKDRLAAAEQAATRRRPVAFRAGFASLARHLARDLDLRLGHRVLGIGKDSAGFRIEVEGHGGAELVLRSERLVSALPLAASQDLLNALGPVDTLLALPQAPVTVFGLGYPRDQVPHPLDGFGFLAPKSEGLTILGCLFSSTLFPHCAPKGKVLLTIMVGGRLRPELNTLTEDALLLRVRADLQRLLGINGAPCMHVCHQWRPGIPQYTGQVAEIQQQIQLLETANPGLSVLGSWLHGVAVGDCLRAALALAD